MLTFILGFFVVIAGFLMVWKSEWLLDNFGRINFFEEHLGTEGGSRLGYKLIGCAAIIIGIMMITGLIGGFLGWVLSPLTKYANPTPNP